MAVVVAAALVLRLSGLSVAVVVAAATSVRGPCGLRGLILRVRAWPRVLTWLATARTVAALRVARLGAAVKAAALGRAPTACLVVVAADEVGESAHLRRDDACRVVAARGEMRERVHHLWPHVQPASGVGRLERLAGSQDALAKGRDHACWHLVELSLHERGARIIKGSSRVTHVPITRFRLGGFGEQPTGHPLGSYMHRLPVNGRPDPLPLKDGKVPGRYGVDTHTVGELKEGLSNRMRRVLLCCGDEAHEAPQALVVLHPGVGAVGRDLAQAEAPLGEGARLVEAEGVQAREELHLRLRLDEDAPSRQRGHPARVRDGHGDDEGARAREDHEGDCTPQPPRAHGGGCALEVARVAVEAVRCGCHVGSAIGSSAAFGPCARAQRDGGEGEGGEEDSQRVHLCEPLEEHLL